jgi:hypothetical protein
MVSSGQVSLSTISTQSSLFLQDLEVFEGQALGFATLGPQDQFSPAAPQQEWNQGGRGWVLGPTGLGAHSALSLICCVPLSTALSLSEP